MDLIKQKFSNNHIKNALPEVPRASQQRQRPTNEKFNIFVFEKLFKSNDSKGKHERHR
jgi:hypothetical protein